MSWTTIGALPITGTFSALDSIRGGPRTPVIAAFYIISIFLMSNGSKAADLDLISTFKSHLEKRPVAVECAFRKKLSLQNIPEAAREQLYFFRWQAGSYYVQVINRIDDIDVFHRGTICGGKNGRDLWERHGGELTVFNLDINPTAPEKNSVYVNEMVLDKTVGLVLDLGITELDQKSIKWDGNSLRLSDESGKLIVGDLKETAKDTLELSLVVAPSTSPHAVIEYRYKDGFAERKFPQRIVRKQRNRDGNLSEIFDLNILQYASPSVPFDGTLMSIERFVDPKATGLAPVWWTGVG